ncbi:MAG: SIMPL domain-containing protein [Bacteroidota bacterium]
MKKTLIALALLASFQPVIGQVMGNEHYNSSFEPYQYGQPVFQSKAGTPRVSLGITPDPNAIRITVTALANVKAEKFHAIFNVIQVGEDLAEINGLLNRRIDSITGSLKNKMKVEYFTDMISFVPVYEYEVTKKRFSRKTYNEIPKGFEMSVNLHISYENPDILRDIVSACAAAEVYDLVRVDYFSSQLEAMRSQLAEKAKAFYIAKSKTYEELLETDFSTLHKTIADGFRVAYPNEMYASYQAFASSSLNARKTDVVTTTQKATTQYYQPIVQQFDVVINPEVVEPVIQVVYELSCVIQLPVKTPDKPEKSYLLISPNGDVKNLDIHL